MDKYKASNGAYYTRQLFYEEWVSLMESERKTAPLFSLYRDRPGLLNLSKEYVALEDPTGYRLATEVLGDYRFWEVLMKTKWFQAAKKNWDEELDAKLASEGLRKLKELMDSGLPAQQLAAAKYLANREHRKDKSVTKGRPNKAQVEAAAREEATFSRQLEEDFNRIRMARP